MLPRKVHQLSQNPARKSWKAAHYTATSDMFTVKHVTKSASFVEKLSKQATISKFICGSIPANDLKSAKLLLLTANFTNIEKFVTWNEKTFPAWFVKKFSSQNSNWDFTWNDFIQTATTMESEWTLRQTDRYHCGTCELKFVAMDKYEKHLKLNDCNKYKEIAPATAEKAAERRGKGIQVPWVWEVSWSFPFEFSSELNFLRFPA